MSTTLPSQPLALVVDDDDQSSKLLQRFLEAEGFAVVCSISAEDALVVAPKHELALITLDLQMFGMNGWQFLQKMHESRLHPHVPVIVVSGRPVPDDLVQRRGVVTALQKPICLIQLKAILDKLGLLKARSTA